MKKIIIFCFTLMLILVLSTELFDKVENNYKIVEDYQTFIVEKKYFDNIKVIIDESEKEIKYGVVDNFENEVVFYENETSNFGDIDFEKQVITKKISDYKPGNSYDKYVIFYVKDNQNNAIELLDTIETYFIDNEIDMNLKMNLNQLDTYLYDDSNLNEYLYGSIIFAILVTSLILLYAFIHFNNQGKKMAINKLYGTNFFTHLDLVLLLVIICSLFVLKFIFTLYLLLTILTVYIIKYLLYRKCNIISNIKNKPIINNFEITLLIYNTILKIVILTVYIAILFFIPKVLEYQKASNLWNNVANYSVTESAFVSCCGNKEDSIQEDYGWRSDYYQYMSNNYQAMIIPIKNGPNTSNFTSEVYEVSNSFFDIQNLNYPIDNSKGAILVRSNESDKIEEYLKTLAYNIPNDNPDLIEAMPIINIDNAAIYTYDTLVGYDYDSIYVVFPNSIDLIRNSDQIIYYNLNNNTEPLESFYASKDVKIPVSKTDPSFYLRGMNEIQKYNSIVKLCIFLFFSIVLVNLFIAKNMIDMYQEKNIKVNTIKKILGYKNFEIHRNFYVTFHTIDIIIVFIILILGTLLHLFVYAVLIGIIHILVTFGYSYIYIGANSKTKLVAALKGKI